ncbi:MAG: hypothetical protein CO187_06385 [Zetaproteobacteria bacterium CG_4_9_14_3_um_filter_53_7]|nr:MAG: hypothetical protein CO187_06385 [Zetaproteobacteria bacterium CG_4_9_14_3_um_filter_53_7]
MDHPADHDHDPLKQLLAVTPEDDAVAQQSVQKAVQTARRHVGTHDVLSLMLVNLWQVLAQMLAPLFLIKKHELNHNKENNHGQP